MIRKDFSKINVNPVYNTIAEATSTQDAQNDADAQNTQYTQEIQEVQKKSRKTYSDAEKSEALEQMQTSGKKGVQLPRINLAFKPSNLEYCRTMAALKGESITTFINDLISQSAEENAALYEQAKTLKNSVK